MVGTHSQIGTGVLILELLLVLWSGAFEVSNIMGCIDFSLMPEGYAREI